MGWLMQGMAQPLVCTSRSKLYIRGAHLWHQHYDKDTARLAHSRKSLEQVSIALVGKSSCRGRHRARRPKSAHTHTVCTLRFPWDVQISHETSWLLFCKGSFWASGSFGVNPRSSKVPTALQSPISHPAACEVSMTCLVVGFQLRSHTSPRLFPAAPQAYPDPTSCQCQVWILAGMGQHQARWESSPNGRTRTLGKERARAEVGQMRKDP